MKKLVSLFAASALLLTAGCSTTPATGTPSASALPSAVPSQSATATGNYVGEGSGYHGSLKVEVTMDNGVMTDLKLLENNESSPVITRAFPLMKDRILEAQSPIVDSVSAATFSSFAIQGRRGRCRQAVRRGLRLHHHGHRL